MTTQTTQDILAIVNEWESTDKSDFIEELLEFAMTKGQREFVLHSLQYNTPLKGDAQ